MKSILDPWQYTKEPPPEPSAGLLKWLPRFEAGFRRNRRLRTMGYEEAMEYFQVYWWEYFNVLLPVIKKQEGW